MDIEKIILSYFESGEFDITDNLEMMDDGDEVKILSIIHYLQNMNHKEKTSFDGCLEDEEIAVFIDKGHEDPEFIARLNHLAECSHCFNKTLEVMELLNIEVEEIDMSIVSAVSQKLEIETAVKIKSRKAAALNAASRCRGSGPCKIRTLSQTQVVSIRNSDLLICAFSSRLPACHGSSEGGSAMSKKS